MTRAVLSLSCLGLCATLLVSPVFSQTTPARGTVRGSLVEDRAARKLLEAGDTRYEADEIKEALEIWKSVIERYPRSRVRFQAHMRLGDYYLERDRAYDRARASYEGVITEENRDEEQLAEATLKVGICFYHSRLYGKCFTIMRDVIEKYPVSPQVNQAYHYIGLGHFQLGHYSRAIAALEKVGTALESEEGKAEKLEAGKRLFVKIDDADLSALEPGTAVKVRCEVTSGDVEIVSCFPVGRNVRVVLGTIPTRLGKPVPNNGSLEVKGNDRVKVTYVDQHTADKQLDRPVLKDVAVVGNANVSITDGAFSETLRGVVLDKSINVQISDADHDLGDEANELEAVLELYRYKTEEELESEAAQRAAAEDTEGDAPETADLAGEDEDEEKIDPLKLVDSVRVTLVEARVAKALSSFAIDPEALDRATRTEEEPAADEPADEPAKESPDAAAEKTEEGSTAEEPASETEPGTQPENDNSIHSGVFRGRVVLEKAEEIIPDDDRLQALPGYIVRVVYQDERHTGDGIKQRHAEARCVEGNIGGVRVTRAVISDEELRLQTRLNTAAALTNIGNRYKEFGLKASASSKYQQALEVCDEIMGEARKLGGSALEQTYVQLWKIYFEMDRLDLAAAMAQRLQREFPTSGFVDEALLQLGDVARKQNDLQRAIGIYNRLVNMKTSNLRGEAQFGIAECYEKMAEDAPETSAASMYDRAFQEYKKVFDQYPDSGRVGEAVSKMANYYYKQKDYARAIDTFETVLNDHPDAKFLDVVLFNYGRCLYRMGRRAEAQSKFDQLIGDYPQSALAGDAKKISDALSRAGS